MTDMQREVLSPEKQLSLTKEQLLTKAQDLCQLQHQLQKQHLYQPIVTAHVAIMVRDEMLSQLEQYAATTFTVTDFWFSAVGQGIYNFVVNNVTVSVRVTAFEREWDSRLSYDKPEDYGDFAPYQLESASPKEKEWARLKLAITQALENYFCGSQVAVNRCQTSQKELVLRLEKRNWNQSIALEEEE